MKKGLLLIWVLSLLLTFVSCGNGGKKAKTDDYFDRIQSKDDITTSNNSDDTYLEHRIIEKGKYEKWKRLSIEEEKQTGMNTVSHEYTFSKNGRGISRFYDVTVAGKKLLNTESFTWEVKNGKLYIKGADVVFQIKDKGNELKIGDDTYR